MGEGGGVDVLDGWRAVIAFVVGGEDAIEMAAEVLSEAHEVAGGLDAAGVGIEGEEAAGEAGDGADMDIGGCQGGAEVAVELLEIDGGAGEEGDVVVAAEAIEGPGEDAGGAAVGHDAGVHDEDAGARGCAIHAFSGRRRR